MTSASGGAQENQTNADMGAGGGSKRPENFVDIILWPLSKNWALRKLGCKKCSFLVNLLGFPFPHETE